MPGAHARLGYGSFVEYIERVHRALHRGEVAVEGAAPAALRFSHSEGTPYGGRITPLAAETCANAFRALRGMGFGEADVRRALRQSAADSDQSPNLESALRRALLELTQRHATKAA